MRKKCAICGTPFTTKRTLQKYCSRECGSIANLKNFHKRYAEKKNGKSTRPAKTNDQLCWTCKNACGGCSWSSEFKPVEDWTAKKTKLRLTRGEHTQSFEITECPEYIPDD